MSYKLCLAPMMDCTDRHFRYFISLASCNIRLYSEMVIADALLYREPEFFLGHAKLNSNVALQLGGWDPDKLSKAAVLGQKFNYDEINLNAGCPSDKVLEGSFGASLMANPKLVAKCLTAMQKNIDIPVSIKHRIGIDNLDSYEYLYNFVSTIAENSPCKVFIVHARKAILKGLSPKQNRSIPPLIYEWVWKLKESFPSLKIVINGGINSIKQVEQQLTKVDGVMLGRLAYEDPYKFLEIENYIFNKATIISREEWLNLYFTYIEKQLKKGEKLHYMTRHLLGLFKGQKNAKMWRSSLSCSIPKSKQNIGMLKELVNKVFSRV